MREKSNHRTEGER